LVFVNKIFCGLKYKKRDLLCQWKKSIIIEACASFHYLVLDNAVIKMFKMNYGNLGR